LGGSLPSNRHLTFAPRLAEVKALVEVVNVHAMLDVSDGLAADLHHLLKSSELGATLDADCIPLTESALRSQDDRSPLQHGLSDGEDFELLFAVSPEDGQRLISEWNEATPVTKIGEIHRDPGCWLRDSMGMVEALGPIGWTHPLGNAPEVR
jgi:thiamine-monophosphate kinase